MQDTSRTPVHLRLGLALLALGLAACGGDDGAQGPQGPPNQPPTSRVVAPGQPGPGIVASIVRVFGGTGVGGNAVPGDRITVEFTIAQDDGRAWSLEEMDDVRIAVSGPTFSYQRVIAERSDVRARAVAVERGTYRYTFPVGLPSAFLPPLNDGPDYGPDDGELAGQPLLGGTYTVTMAFRWEYTVEGEPFREDANASGDFLLGISGALAPRDVVRTENCARCHEEVQFHGGRRRTVTSCLMCHTAGMESSQPPNSVLGRREHLSFQAMIHRLHSGRSLPSVQGVTTDPSGQRDYDVPPADYRYADVVWPRWPVLSSPMLRDQGHSALSPANQAKEDAIRSGAVDCTACHGDPDGAGPLEAPAQGDLAYDQPSRHACTTCHDDWIPELPYEANGVVMPPQLDDGSCRVCHPSTGSFLSVRDAHVHPLLEPNYVDGINIEIQGVVERTGNMNGTLEVGETPVVEFTVRDDGGADVDVTTLGSVEVAVNGPTTNHQLVVLGSIPADRLVGAQPFSATLPEIVHYEFVGTGTGAAQVLGTARAPHWNVTDAPTEVFVATPAGPSTTLAQPAAAPVNFIDVADATGFARDDFVVVRPGTAERECLQIQWVDGNRLWFSSPATDAYAPGPAVDHPMGTTVEAVDLAPQTEGVDYTLNAIAGTVDGTFASGAPVFVRYTTDFVVPATYPLALNAGPDLGPADGGWAGYDVVDGTYTLTLWASRGLTIDQFGETNSYREGSPDAAVEFQIGDPITGEPYGLIDSFDGCYRCHSEVQFHGDRRRGVASCIACHGNAASGDRPRYVAANAPATDGVEIGFREMIHAIHAGSELERDYVVVGFGFGYPDNFSENRFDDVEFTAMPSGSKDCAACHGADNEAWFEPASRDHPTQQSSPSQPWTIVCAACHDSAAATDHIQSNTTPGGVESCSICHGEGRSVPVDLSHFIR